MDIPELKHCSTFQMGGKPKSFQAIHTVFELIEALQDLRTVTAPVWILGGGSNTVFTDNFLPYSVLQIKIPGMQVLTEDADTVRVKVNAGESWDGLVETLVGNGWSGLELLSGVPGTVGAAPMQNIGAYAVELASVLESVEVVNRSTMQLEALTRDQCNFGYRTSIFKTTARGKYVIVAATFRLTKRVPQSPTHPEVAKEVGDTVTAKNIRRAVLAIRRRKLVDYSQIPNVGSFFQNPIIPEAQARALLSRYPTMPVFAQSNGMYKVTAGWLLEQAGYKGRLIGHFQFSPKHALILTHLGGGTMDELQVLIQTVARDIKKRFNISLHPEPELVY